MGKCAALDGEGARCPPVDATAASIPGSAIREKAVPRKRTLPTGQTRYSQGRCKKVQWMTF
jgi:hypothetical protein